MLREVAEAIENVLLEDTARGVVSSYSIDIVPDDNRIEVFLTKVVPIKNITVKYSVRRASSITTGGSDER